MPAPLVGAAALAAARLIAGQVAKQSVKKGAVRLAARGTAQSVNKSAKGKRVMTRATTTGKTTRTPAKRPTVAKTREENIKKASERLSTRNVTQLSRDMTKVKINPAALGSRLKSNKPTPNRGGGLRTTTGQGKKKTSKADVFEAVRGMSQRPGGSSTITGTGAVRGTAPKPGVRITTRTSRGTSVQKPIKRIDPKEKSSALTVRKTAARKREDIIAQKNKEKRDRVREALTIRVNPARPKTTPQRGAGGSGGRTERSQEILDRYYRIKFGDKGGPVSRSGQGAQPSIESRIASGSERAPRTRSRDDKDFEADKLVDRSIRAIENPKLAAKERIKPGKQTKVSKAIKSGNKADIKRSTENMRKVLKEREIKEAAERIRLAKEAAMKAKRAK